MTWGCIPQSLQLPIAYLILKTQWFLQEKVVFNPCCHPGELCGQTLPAVGGEKLKRRGLVFYRI